MPGTPAINARPDALASPGPRSARASPGLLRLALAAGTLPVVLLVVLVIYALMQSRDQYLARAELNSQNLAAAVERSVAAHVEGVDLALKLMVDHLQQQLVQGPLDRRAASRLLAMHLAHRPELLSIRITDARGQVLVEALASAAWEAGAEAADADVLQAQPRPGLVMSPPWIHPGSGARLLSFSRHYRDTQGRWAGAVTASLPVLFLEQQLGLVQRGEQGAVVLRGLDYRLLARQPPLPEGAVSEGAEHSASSRLRALVESGQAAASFRARSPADGVDRVSSFRRMEAAPILVLAGLATEESLQGWYRELHISGAVSAGLLLLYALGSGLIWRVARQYQQARERAELLAKVFEHSAEAILMTDKRNRIIEVNPAFVAQTGYSPQEVVGRHPRLLASARTSDEQYDGIWQTLLAQGHWQGELWGRRRDGEEQAKFMSMSIVRDERGELTHHVVSALDLTVVKEAERKLLHLSQHDALTHLPNRSHLQGRLTQALAQARRQSQFVAMLVIDLDRFKNINDTLGHQTGDRLLIEVGRRLLGVVRDSDIVARLGGDEFVLVLTGLPSETKASRAASAVATKVLSALVQPFCWGPHALQTTPSIGISLYPADGTDADTLLKNSDTAMYQAKAAGGNCARFFTPAMNEAATERLVLELGLRGAIERGELFVQYQPQLDVRHDRVVGLEALVRWRHPERGLIPPLKFIPVAEETGQIEAIGAWVLDQALTEVARWRAAGRMDLRVAVNLSAQQLRREHFDAEVAQALVNHQLPGQALELEITESMAMRDPDRTVALLNQLRMLGVGLAIDDFGTGYSSLAYLKRLPLSCLKLDRSFVMDIERDPNDAAICTATIQMAHSLGLGVVAEGVETQTQLDFLRELGCDTVQGYFISKPLSPADCTQFLQPAAQGPAPAHAQTAQEQPGAVSPA